MNAMLQSTTERSAGAGWREAGVSKRMRDRLLQSLWVQLVFGLLFAVVMPAFARWDLGLVTAINPGQYPSVIGTAIAFVIGLLLIRRFTNFPGVQAAAYILPVFAICYGLLVAALLFGRFEFARIQLGASFMLASIWCFLVWYLTRYRRRLSIAVVPFGSYKEFLAHAGSVNTRILTEPDMDGLRADAVVADLRADYPDQWERFLANCAIGGLPVFHMKQIAESLTGRVRIEHLSENNLGALLPSPEYMAAKRVAETLAVVLTMPLTLPLMAVLAIAIRCNSPGPAIFRQVRMGHRGRPFTMLKFRTMQHDHAGPEFTQATDPRITSIGRWMRKTRLDELPQLLNVLKGQMSLIGPRPESLPLSDWYDREIPHYRYRHIVRPGITGWAQVQQGFAAEVEDVTDKLHYDFYYIKHFSPWLDLLILLKTVHVVLTGKGAR
ncbi:MAG: sugar transferase [Pseudomonadota bacterium]|nr:sugar transferase [Pseudomonadota bacterium]